MNNLEYLAPIAEAFGFNLQSAEKSKDTALSEVYMVNGTHVFRGRVRAQEDIQKLKSELALIERVRGALSPLLLPTLIPTKSGEAFLETEKFLWTLYPLIPGSITCSWFNLEHCGDPRLEELMKLLKEMHSKTSGKYRKKDMGTFFEKDVKKIFGETKPLLKKHVKARVEEAYAKVVKWRKNLPRETLCFTHNDFHPGNVIFDKEKPQGFIDLDWIRVGDPLEDLSYSVMMLMRLYERKKFSFHKNRLFLLLRSYGLKNEEKEIFFEYLILFAMYEISITYRYPKPEFYLGFQLEMLEFLTGPDFVKTISQSIPIASTGSPI